MSNAPQAQKPQAQNIPSSPQNPSKTAPVAGNMKKDEQAGKDMQSEGGSCSSSSDKNKKPTEGGCK